MSRIEERFESQVLALFSWITYAYRPLTTDELSEAVSVSLGLDIDNDNDPPMDRDKLLAMCQGLVVLSTDGTVLFVHKTVADFFRNSYHLFSHAEIAISCLTYLGLEAFDRECLDEKSLKARVETYKFISYAAVYWPNHIKDAEDDPDVQQAVYSLFADETKRTAIRRTEQYVTLGYEDIEFEPLLVVMAEKGLSKICSMILDRRTSGNRSFLSYNT
jgi:hypothetical protein